ncbi:hypothetical protein C9994_08895 [Marivirga lumbricoides]|uniref:Uncharacterized protein n=1 Tax=Marivirga lumbricoides TaxID=1046115 RepID=A0A2T4DQJ7_9BACT|nr:hypothetical protein C9994_08895 [Marivirga lumbricoides]
MVQFKGTQSEDKIPQWLETIQENSWEAELLLSAVLLFGLIQTPIYLAEWSNHVLSWETSPFASLVASFIKGLELLRVGFIFHIIIRAMWIAQVGFSYVYPKGINVSNLKFKGRFRSELERSDSMVKSIMNLEKLASIIFAVSFSLFGLLIGFLGYILPYILLSLPLANNNLSNGTEIILITSITIYSLLSFFVFIDFVTNGLFRRGRRRAMLFYPIAWFFRIVTLSFLYKKTLLTLISNTKGYKRYIISGSLVLVVILNDKPAEFLKEYAIDTYAANTKNGFAQNANYESKRKPDDLLVLTIPSDLMNAKVLSIFLKDQSILSYRAPKEEKEDSTKRGNFNITTNANDNEFYARKKNLHKILEITIDSIPVETSEWINTTHPTNYERGFLSYVNIEGLSPDLHKLRVVLKGDTLSYSHRTDSLLANIPFYKTN